MDEPRIVRLAASAALASLIVAGPAAYTLGGEPWAASPPWRMFEHVGLGHCDVRFEAGGERLDRYAPFGARGRMDAPPEVRDIHDEAARERIALRICDATRVERVRVRTRCANERGWQEEPDLEVPCPR